MKKSIIISVLLLTAFTIWGCSDSTSPGSAIEEASSERQFIWDAMNFWYFWQENVAELADNKTFFDDEQAFQNYLMGFSSSRALFDDLQFEQDDFSFFIDNFEEFQQSRQGISKDFGFNFGLVQQNSQGDVFGYVQFVLPDSPADDAGLTRGDVFTGINGTRLTVNNFSEVLSGDSYELIMAEFIEGEISETGETIQVNAVVLQEDPIFLSKIIDTGTSKVGYLVYNAYRTNSHQDLNDVFGTFQSENIDELVVDVRYNGGGALVTSTALSTMISGLGDSELFAEFTFNSKRSGQNQTIDFMDELPVFNDEGSQESEVPINTLSLNRVFVLTGFGTASASETMINGIDPFMEVILIGRQTVGKDEGSITLFDSPSPFTDDDNANPDHKTAIQPIVLKIVNSLGQDYPDGFTPDFPVNEINFLQTNGTLPVLGDENEPLLSKALEVINGEPVAKTTAANSLLYPEFEMIGDSRDLVQFGKEMYLLPAELEKMEF